MVAIVVTASAATFAEGATIEGRVIDAETGTPLPYANVGVPAGFEGTVTGEDGRYVLRFPAALDSLVYSAIGYEPKQVSCPELIRSADVALRPRSIAVHESVVVEARPGGGGGRDVTLGRKLAFRGHGIGFGSGQLGSEVGARIRIDEPTLVRSANFVISHTRGDAFLYRVNVYDLDEGRAGRKLLDRNVIVPGLGEKGTMTVDLSQHDLVVERDVLLALEWIKDDDQAAGVPPLMFRAKRGRAGNIYQRRSSQGAFEKVESIGIGFYLTGLQAD